MGSLENALLLARTVGETVTKVQGPLDVYLMMDPIHTTFEELHKKGPQDQWWESVRSLYDDCVKHAPQSCRTLSEYAQWAEHMIRFWLTLLSAREILVAWAGRDATSLETKISPANLIRVRDLDLSTDLPKGQTSIIETIGNETVDAIKKRGIDCFDPWTAAQYRTRFSFAKNRQQLKIMHHQASSLDMSLLCGFYSWMQRAPQSPSSARPTERIIGKEILRTRTLWTEEIAPERIGFRAVPADGGRTSLLFDEAALRIALDLMKVASDAKLPLVLPESKKP